MFHPRVVDMISSPGIIILMIVVVAIFLTIGLLLRSNRSHKPMPPYSINEKAETALS